LRFLQSGHQLHYNPRTTFHFEPRNFNWTKTVFHYDQGLFLTRLGLAIDVLRRRKWGYISHAHADHIAPHERIMATPETLAILQRRLRGSLTFDSLEFDKPVIRNSVRLMALRAGHILGASMLQVETDDTKFLLTGDYSLSDSLTAGPAKLVKADVLLMECTFGHKDYRLPCRESVSQRLIETCTRMLRLGKTPLIRTYVLGKSQELIRIFSDAGVPVAVHPAIDQFAEIYREFGCDTGNYVSCEDGIPQGHVVILPPSGSKESNRYAPPNPHEELAVTGWAAKADHPRMRHIKYRFALSDHADYNQLLETVERVEPKRIYCYHGFPSFVDDLRALGHDARWLPECQSIH
jgi:putative mRNA 3-end processing factor